jgi:cellulose synthase/poly-beta-1,6-N-acetylglucosamine synthase-like glycosyltransferase
LYRVEGPIGGLNKGNYMFSAVLTLIAVLVGIPAFALLTLTLAAIVRKYRGALLSQASSEPTLLLPRLAILVPAHNESHHLVPTVKSLFVQLKQRGQGDRLIVIADNCSDDTARQARQAGATVIERIAALKRGKGYALAFGVDYLRPDPPDVVVVVDADCLLSDGALSAIAQVCQETGRPVQMPSLMYATEGAGLTIRTMEFAMLMKNFVRPLGSSQLGDACHLMGTGMALPWALIAKAQLATPHIVEDLMLGIDLASLGYPAVFLPAFPVTSTFMNNPDIVRKQKERWEHGYLQVMLAKLPSMITIAFRRRDLSLAVLALDLSIPPIALYFMVLGTVLIGTGLAACFSAALYDALWTLLGVDVCFAMAIVLGWWFFGRRILTLSDLLKVPLYAIWKLPIYLTFILKKRARWIRTERDDR